MRREKGEKVRKDRKKRECVCGKKEGVCVCERGKKGEKVRKDRKRVCVYVCVCEREIVLF